MTPSSKSRRAAIVLFAEAGREAVGGEARGQPFLCGRAEHRRLGKLGGRQRVAAGAKRGRMGLRVRGHQAARMAISTVFSIASGRSANSAAISARDLK